MFNIRREKLMSQLECKRRVDSLFKDQGRPRFKQAEIDLKYQSLLHSIDDVMSLLHSIDDVMSLLHSIDDVMSRDSGLLQQSLPHVDMQMAVSLTIVAVEHDHSHLLAVYLKRLH